MSEDSEAYRVANEAMMRIEHHEILCGERYQQIVTNQVASSKEREKMRQLISDRFKDLYGFLWKIAIGIIVMLLGICGTLLLFFLNNAVVWRPPA